DGPAGQSVRRPRRCPARDLCLRRPQPAGAVHRAIQRDDLGARTRPAPAATSSIIITRGHNYGWPAITFGINYNGTTISNDTARAGMDQPVVHWTPSISPSGLTIYSGDRFPGWPAMSFSAPSAV